MKRTAIFPGSFDPFTEGHRIVMEDGLRLFDRIVVGVGINTEKQGLLPPERRVALIADVFAGQPKVEVRTYDGLTVDFARAVGAEYILRGMRNTVDFEFERNMTQVNRTLDPDIHTVLIFTPAQYVAISSSFVREIHSLGGDTAPFMPEGILLENYLK
jgi:pantetheine-phosphate adenylyltransferase